MPTAPTFLVARDRGVHDVPTTVHNSGQVIPCTWCQGSGQR